MKRPLLVLGVVAFAACSSSTDLEDFALRAGTYSISFEVPNSFTTPGGHIGDHDLTFRVVDPVSEQSSFMLLSSVHISRTVSGNIGSTRHDYLDPDPRSVIPALSQWRLQWWFVGSERAAVRLNMSEGDDGEFYLPFGCGTVLDEIENFQGVGCIVTRME